MTPSETAKKHGLKSLEELARLTGESRQTLINWHRNKPLRFELMCVGVINKLLVKEVTK
jgi:transcriptional regulator with XRE-family HTH domain